ncbi:MAG: sigma-70 family RNA polymerase sigma factor [Pirellulales bacterium]|nr:sigma-70 family RNA polymerase sigma factor [Pirellulales bacterium]
MSDVTHILASIENGDARAAEELLPLVYNQLKREAQRRMAAERPDHTLQATALVHEAYRRLAGDRRVPWRNAAHFYAAAAEAMRRILLDHARAKRTQKRSGQRRRIPLDLADVAESWNLEEILSLNEALSRLEMEHPTVSNVVRLRFFAGLSIDETASALDISKATVKRRWEFGRTWLFRMLTQGEDHD